jgi:hypothetical protein
MRRFRFAWLGKRSVQDGYRKSQGGVMSTIAIIAIVAGAVILLALIASAIAKPRIDGRRRGRARDLRDRAAIREARAQKEQATAAEQRARARRASAEAEERSRLADRELAAAGKEQRRADGVDPDR